MKTLTKIIFLLCLIISTRQLNAAENVYDPIVGKGRYIVTPKAAATPRINGPSIFGVRPGNPFLYAIPATGERPMEFSVENLPEGLSVNPENGHITGRIRSTEKKTYNVTLKARNSKGTYEKAFRIVVGDQIALTPPLGWNSWNCWHQKVSQEKVLESARAMYDAGLQRVGWTYINMDDGWQAKRGGKHNAVMPNAKFPDMKGMVDEIHAMGFKAGIYHTPWVGSYAGYCGGSSHQEDGHDWPTDSVDGVGDKERYKYFHVGEHKFDKEDTLQWADWGIDYLKDDWDLGRDITPAAVARRKKALRECGRDIVYSLSNTGPLKFADTFVNDSNAWRISADIRGDWDTRGKGAGSILAIMNLMKGWAPYCGPGHYPDADMMMVDGVRGGNPSKLTGDEQYSHVSLWSLWSSPMLLGSAVDKMGDFGLSILSNPEVLEIHQDALCKMATVKNSDPLGQVWVKPLENGDSAVGLINLADDPRVITANWSEIGVQGKRLVRDVWRQRNIQVFEDSFSAKVPPHGTVLVRLSDPVDGVVAAGKGMKQLPAAPVITPPGGISKGATTVSLKTDSDATIYYTLDGSRPNKQSRVYTKPFTISVFTDVKAVAIKDGVESGVSTAQFFVAPKSIPAPDVDATTLEKVHSYAEWRDVEINKTGRYHEPFKHQGTVYKQGLGFYGAGSISYQLDPNYKRFVAMAVVDDSSAENTVGRFVVEIDGKLASSSPLMKKGDSAWLFDVEIPEGAKTIRLICYRDGVGPQFVFDYLNCGFIKQSAVVNVDASVSFPGPSPEKANISLQPSRSILKNKVIEAVFEKTGTSARLASVHDLMAGRTYTFNSPLFVVTVDDNTQISSDDMVLEGEWKVEDLVPNPEAAILARRLAGKKLTAVLRHPDSGLKAIWSALLCDGSNYIRQEVRFSSDRPLKLDSVALIVASLDGAAVKGSVAGSPIVAGNLFMGFEHPLSENAVSNMTSVKCSYARHTTLKGDDFYNCSAVIGVAPENQLRRAFLYYLERERAHPYRQYLHYNTWYDLNISRPKNRMTEEEVLASVNTIGTELVKKRGVQMEGFVMDDGWDSHESVWDFHEQFPNGFDGVGKVAASYQAGLGVWLSPWGGYGEEKKSRMQHGKLAGFEVNKKGFAMSGKNYGRHFKGTCYRMMKDAGVNHFKFDGMGGGNFSDGARDELADDINAILDMTGELRGYNKEVWINATVGTWPSPFWTRYADSIWRQGGDTDFAGVGSKREQWITYRDQFSYERIMQRGPLYPLNSLMFHGVVIGSRHNPGEMELNETSVRHEIRAAFGCGSGLQELYITPKLLTKQMWDDIAQSAKWARSNVDVMADTHWVGGNPGKLEVYGWASWSPKKGVLTLRNPNQVAQTYKLDIAKAFELPENATKAYSLISPYQDQRLQKIDVEAGAVIEVRLEPFEVLVFDAHPEHSSQKNAPEKK